MVSVLKQIVLAIQATVVKDYRIKLNLRFGFLKFTSSRFFWENAPMPGEPDGVTSANSEFRMNKRFLTNIRERPGGNSSVLPPDSTSTFYSSVVTTIKQASQTPR